MPDKQSVPFLNSQAQRDKYTSRVRIYRAGSAEQREYQEENSSLKNKTATDVVLHSSKGLQMFLTNGSPVHVSVGQETSLSKGVEVGFGFYGNWHETDVSDKW